VILHRVGIITGLAAEAECFQGLKADDRLKVVCVAADPDRAAAAAGVLAGPGGCGGLVSFGVAGGLAPGAPPGALLLADAVVTLQGETLATDPGWRQRLIAGLDWPLPPIEEKMIGTDTPVESAEQKRALWRRTGAFAVDTESHAVARAAVAANIPFLVVRAIADPWHRDVPPWLAATIADDGAPDLGAVLAGLAQRPWHLPRLAALGLDFRRAMKTLRRVALRGGPLFFFR
jgi:adenosylhomocysteine nucleosidase